MKRSYPLGEALSLSPTHPSPPAAPSSVPLPPVAAVAADDLSPQATTFPYRDYIAAKQDLLAAIRGGPFYGLVFALSGMGKTCLMRDVWASLDRHRYQLLYLSAANVSLLGISRFFAQTCHIAPKRTFIETCKVLADVLKAQPVQQLLWIDEADRVSADTIAELRILAECDREIPQMFSIIFSGLPELGSLISSPKLFPLKRRITVRVQLTGLCRDELAAFLAHRFGSVDEKRIPPELRDEIFERTLATPALIERVVKRILERAGQERVAEAHLREALDAQGL